FGVSHAPPRAMAALALPLLLLLLLGSPGSAPKSGRNCPGNPPGTCLLVLTVATEVTDGYRRFLRSAHAFNYSVKTLGLGRRWRGGDIARSPGGGQKVRWLRAALEPLRGRGGLVVLFVDSYDVVLAGPPRELLAKFRAAAGAVVFAAERFCWPREELAPLYPPCPPRETLPQPRGNGGFVGYAPALWALVERWRFRDDDDDQLFYTQLYLNRELRLIFGVPELIFGVPSPDEVRIRFEPGGNRVRNELSGSWPVVIHGNGPTKVALNSLGNYVPLGWSPRGCGDCERDLRPLGGTPALPWVLIGVFVAEPTPFLPQFLRRLRGLRYPRERMGLFLHNAVSHAPLLDSLWPRLQRRFSSAHREGEGLGGGAARELGMYGGEGPKGVTLNNPRQVLAPLLARPGHLWSNFWGALSPEGFYARAPDYLEILHGNRRGVWNVPYVSRAYLVGGAALRGPLGEGPVFDHAHLDPDMAFCARAREKGLFLSRCSHFWGFFWEFFGGFFGGFFWDFLGDFWDFGNLGFWGSRGDFWGEFPVFQPCPDVFQFPLFSAQFGQELREEAELRGGWAEHHEVLSWAVPLSSLHLDLVLQGALRELLPPIARRLFPGYAPKVGGACGKGAWLGEWEGLGRKGGACGMGGA
uniref:PLOD1-3-like GT domain-containing protein n=1 Tax=Geospiza parvula TaxID=87175 RepID=A0A8U8B1C4_GEOPR